MLYQLSHPGTQVYVFSDRGACLNARKTVVTDTLKHNAKYHFPRVIPFFWAYNMPATLAIIYWLRKTIKIPVGRGTWVTQSVKGLTLAQVMISQFMSSSPMSSSVLAVCSLLGILSLCPSLAHALSLKINK